VSGKDPFGQTLDRAVNGQHFEGHSLVVRRLPAVTAASGCQIVYLGPSSDQTLAQSLEALRGQPILTVSDSSSSPPPNSEERGIINFLIEDNKVRFQIDEHAAAQNHLALSSKLLSLAVQKAK
jgi:hypothetical protein